MSYADQVFISMCEDILENGTSTEGEKVRPHWPDGESAYTIKQFGVVNRYDGSGRKNQIMFMILRVTYGMNGQMKTVPLEKLMDTRWESNINTKRE